MNANGVLRIFRNYDREHLGQPQVTYAWEGGDVVQLDRLVLMVHGVETNAAEGRVQVGPFELRRLGQGAGTSAFYVRDRGRLHFWAALARFRWGESWQLIGHGAIRLLGIWGLAETHWAVEATWRDVRLLRRLAEWWQGQRAEGEWPK